MEGAEKGSSSTANVKKKSSDLDDVIGKDFLTSWKDEMDFSTGTPPRGKKTNFSFDKDDDFELGGDFGNFLSFKMDLSELDFSSPGRKIESPMEKSGKEAAQPKAKKDSFSYNFDFPELESFGLDSNLLKGEKKVIVDNKTSNGCSKVNKNPEDKIHRNTTIETKEKGPQDSTEIERTDSLMSDHLVEHKNTDIRSYNSSVTVPDCTEMFAQDKHKSGMNVNMNKGSKDQEEMMNAHPRTEKSALASQVQSGDKLAKTHSESQTERQSFTSFNPKFDIELANFGEHPTSPASRRSTSGNGVDLKRTNSMSESSDVDSKLQQNLDKKNEITEESASNHKSDQATKDVGARGLSSKAQTGLKSIHESFRSKLSNPKAFLLSGQKESIKNSECQQGGFSKSYNGEVTKHSLSVLGNDRSKKDGPTSSGELVLNAENACHEDGHPKSFDGEAKQQKLPVLEHDGSKNDNLDSNILRMSTKYSSSCSPIPKNTGLAQFKLMKISSTERPALSAVNKTSEDNASINRIKELNSSLPKVDCQNDSKLVDFHSTTSSKIATNESSNKSALFSPMLKRKASEGSPADPFALRALKRFSESPLDIRNLEVSSPKICGRLARATENTLDCPGDISIEPQATPDVSSDSSLMDIDVSLVMEDDGNVEKAEACAKELDDICNMLKKKHDEAKALLVRAVVNNNYLLMLNHPMYEEKIRTLQRRANSSLSKYQEL